MITHQATRRSILCASAALALLLAGCGQSIEQNKFIAKQQKTVTQLETDSKAIKRRVDELTETVDKLAKDVQVVRNNPQSASGLEMRLNELQKSLAESTLKIAELEKKAAARPAAAPEAAVGGADAKPAKPAAAEATPKPAETAKPAATPAPKKEAGAKPEAAKPTPKATPKATPKPAKQGEEEKPASGGAKKGGFYTVKAGDTAESIASAHGISVESLTKANNVRTLRVQAGNQIFIPAP